MSRERSPEMQCRYYRRALQNVHTLLRVAFDRDKPQERRDECARHAMRILREELASKPRRRRAPASRQEESR